MQNYSFYVKKTLWSGNKPWESSKWIVLQIGIDFGGCPWRIHGENRFFMHFSLHFFGRRATISTHIYQGTLNELVKSLLSSIKQLWFSYIVKRELQGMVSRWWFQGLFPKSPLENLDYAAFYEHSFWSTEPIWEPKRPFESSRPGLSKFECFSHIRHFDQEKNITLEGARNRRFHVFLGGILPPGGILPLTGIVWIFFFFLSTDALR